MQTKRAADALDYSNKALTVADIRPCKGSGHYVIRAKQLQTAMTLCVGAVSPVSSPQTSLRCATLVAMVQTADLREGDNGACLREGDNGACRRRLYGPRVGTILG